MEPTVSSSIALHKRDVDITLLMGGEPSCHESNSLTIISYVSILVTVALS